MEKYLFTDGTNVIREVESEKELQALIESTADTDKIRIWMFNTSEWISLNAYRKSRHYIPVHEKVVTPEVPAISGKKIAKAKSFGLIKKIALVCIAAIVILLVYNFTRVKWSVASAITIVPERPENSPLINVDSLIQNLELSRGQKLDKVTRTNLRIRNTWFDRVILKLNANRDTSNTGSTKYHDLRMTIDNSTGYQIDEAVVEYELWADGNLAYSDTLKFKSIGYATPSVRDVKGEYKGDSLSVKFLSIRARSFNFCYSAEKQSNYGNTNDRWFCK